MIKLIIAARNITFLGGVRRLLDSISDGPSSYYNPALRLEPPRKKNSQPYEKRKWAVSYADIGFRKIILQYILIFFVSVIYAAICSLKPIDLLQIMLYIDIICHD